MKFDLQVTQQRFSELVRTHKHLEIPPFQRPYAWSLDHWSDLWDDITTHLDQDYLMGGVVLCGGDNSSDLVIDGQQRVATITLMIAVCRDYLWRECTADRAKGAAGQIHGEYIVSGGVVAATKKPYITLGELERSWFAEKIQVSPQESNYAPPDLSSIRNKIPSSVRLLWKAYQFFYRQLQRRHAAFSEEKKIDDVITITRQLAECCWFVITRVPDDTHAYTLFEVLNDRGLELSIADLFKNKILSRAAEVNKLEPIKDYWAEVIDSLGYHNIPAFLRYFWMSRNGKKVTENDLFPKFKDDVKSMTGADLVTYLKSLSTEADNFAEIIGVSKTGGRIAREVGLIKSYGFKVGSTVLLAVWASDADEKTRLNALREVKKFLLKFAIFANQVTNELEGMMAELALEIRKDLTTGIQEMERRFAKATPSRKVIREKFLMLEPSPAVARGLLVELEMHLAGTEKAISAPDEVNVEHIFPQSPNKDWVRTFKASGEEESYCSRLGNLTLLGAKLNKQASNNPYKDKRKDCYAKSQFKLTKELPDLATWTTKQVEERQSELFDLAIKVWDIQ